MTLTEMEAAIRAANAELRRADDCASQMAELLVGRLQKISSTYVLRKLKKELQNFNAHTGAWK